MAKNKETEITIINRSAPRVAIQISEISIDTKTKMRRRESIAHLTVANLSGQEAKTIIIKAIVADREVRECYGLLLTPENINP